MVATRDATKERFDIPASVDGRTIVTKCKTTKPSASAHSTQSAAA
jgi:hypothetical protein